MSFEGTNQNYPINHNFNEDIKNFIRVTLACDDFKHFYFDLKNQLVSANSSCNDPPVYMATKVTKGLTNN